MPVDIDHIRYLHGIIVLLKSLTNSPDSNIRLASRRALNRLKNPTKADMDQLKLDAQNSDPNIAVPAIRELERILLTVQRTS